MIVLGERVCKSCWGTGKLDLVICDHCGKEVTGRRKHKNRFENHFCDKKCHDLWKYQGKCVFCGRPRETAKGAYAFCKECYNSFKRLNNICKIKTGEAKELTIALSLITRKERELNEHTKSNV